MFISGRVLEPLKTRKELELGSLSESWGRFESELGFGSKTESGVESGFGSGLVEEDEARSFKPAWICCVKVGTSSIWKGARSQFDRWDGSVLDIPWDGEGEECGGVEGPVYIAWQQTIIRWDGWDRGCGEENIASAFLFS